jgi:hypothetical protein
MEVLRTVTGQHLDFDVRNEIAKPLRCSIKGFSKRRRFIMMLPSRDVYAEAP